MVSVNAQTRLSMRAVSPDPSLLSHMHINGRTYGIIFQSMIRLEVACMQSCQHALLSHMHKMVYIWHILAFKAKTSLSMRAVSPELSLLSHMHNMGVHMAYFISKCSDAPELTRTFTALAHALKWAYIWHILSANAQTRSSMHAVLSEPSLLSHMH